MDRTVYSAAEMQRLVAPRTIAVVGASEQPGAFGERTLTNLARFDGKVFGVNPKYDINAGCDRGMRSTTDVDSDNTFAGAARQHACVE